MATEQQLIEALRKADAAGDTAAAQAIARRIASMRSGTMIDSSATRRSGFTQVGDPDIKRMADPTGTPFENLAAGTGKVFYDAARGLGQLAGVVSEEDVAESRRLDAPLMNTTAGQVGAVTGAAATMIGPGSLAKAAGAPAAVTRALMPTSVKGNAALGAAFGALQPVAPGESRLENAAMGAGGGAAGGYIGQKIAGLGRAQSPRVPDQRAAAIRSARGEGYVLPPSEMGAGLIARTAEGLSGKQQIGQAASSKNQAITNRLARRAIGLPDDAPLNVETLQAVRNSAGEAYEAISSIGTVQPGMGYFRALQRLTKDARQAAKDFPKGTPNPLLDVVESIKARQFDARSAVEQIKSLRDRASEAGRQGNDRLAGQIKKAAGILEDALEQQALKLGQPELARNFRESRQLIAKTYTIQDALTDATGDVSAPVLARLKRTTPISGELKKAADAAEAFPKALQTLKDPYRAFSPMDLAAGSYGVGASSPMLAAFLARPLVRAGALTSPVQSVLARQATQGRMLPQIIPDSSRAQMLLRAQERALPAGMVGLLGSQDEERY